MSTQGCGCDPEAGHRCDRCRIDGLLFALRAIRRLGTSLAESENRGFLAPGQAEIPHVLPTTDAITLIAETNLEV